MKSGIKSGYAIRPDAIHSARCLLGLHPPIVNALHNQYGPMGCIAVFTTVTGIGTLRYYFHTRDTCMPFQRTSVSRTTYKQ